MKTFALLDVSGLDEKEMHMKTLEQVAADYGLTPDGVSFALEQYQKVICEITHSRMSKLSYYADGLLSVANDVRCVGCEYTEPYLMTVEEADNAPYVWLESNQGGLGVRRIRIVPVDSTAISIQTFGRPDTICVLHEFEKHFRCWNIKPSDEQRKNTPWKE